MIPVRRFLFFVALVAMQPGALMAAEDNPVPFEKWLEGIRADAMERGFSASTVRALDGLTRDERVIGFDRRQPEFTQTFDEYLTARVSKSRIDTARRLYREHRDSLEKIAQHYGIDAEFLVAFWGLESSFGRYQGKYSVVRSLATLAHDPRRSRFFTRELMSALQILDEGHIEPENFVGGWAGAMGQNQFIPSSFLNYAQDFDGDGKKNIWNNQDDVWASIAYYLSKNGWRAGKGWGSRVELPEALTATPDPKPRSGCRAYRYHSTRKSLQSWEADGVVLDRSVIDGQYALLVPEPGDSNYRVGGNFGAILSYNCANKYAVSVGLLADLIVDR